MRKQRTTYIIRGSLLLCAIVLAQAAAFPSAKAVVCARGVRARRLPMTVETLLGHL